MTIVEEQLRTALRTATADVTAAPGTVGLVRARVRRRRRRLVAAAVAVPLALAGGLTAVLNGTAGARQGPTAVTAPPTPPPAAVHWTQGGQVVEVGDPPTAWAQLDWLPTAALYGTDDASPGNRFGEMVMSTEKLGVPWPQPRVGSRVWGTAAGGVIAEVVQGTGVEPSVLAGDGGGTLHRSPATVRGLSAQLLQTSDRLYLAWSPVPDIVLVVGVSTPAYGLAELDRIAAATSYRDTAPAPSAADSGNGPATAAVEAAGEQAFRFGSPDALDAVQGGADLRGAVAALVRAHPASADPLVRVRPSFTGPRTALVSYVVGTATEVHGGATWTPQGWKVNRNGYCAVVAQLGGRCPSG